MENYDYEHICSFMCNEDWREIWGDNPHILGLYKAIEYLQEKLDDAEMKLEKEKIDKDNKK
tara:strand:- start:28 stop:210 length:183 start_codon:yes stop_codon:yes gene_type:complete